MGYWEISRMAFDSDLQMRAQACAAQEHEGNPFQWVADNMLNLAAQPGWDAAWSSAEAGGNETPGRDPGVITDGMILSGVQGLQADQGGPV